MARYQKKWDILIYDSGLGGLSVAENIRQARPSASLLYFADHAGFPYGSLSESALLERVLKNVRNLSDKYEFSILVMACNTASTLVLPELRRLLNIQIVGVVPAIKPAASLSQSKVIGLLATPATVSRNYTNELIDEFASECQVIRVGSRRLVEIAEESLFGKITDEEELKDILSPFFSSSSCVPDVIVLACTHFPLLRPQLSEVLQAHTISLLDSGEAIARRVSFLLKEDETTVADSLAITTADFSLFAKIQSVFARFGFKQTLKW